MCLRIDKNISRFRQIKCVLEQETILRLVMFIPYINDLLNFSSSGDVFSFVDIVNEGDTWRNLRKIGPWFFFNGKLLTVSVGKTSYSSSNFPLYLNLLVNTSNATI